MHYKCIIVDDDPVSTGILARYVGSVPALELVATCATSLQAFNLVMSQKIDIMFLDIEMPDIPGTELVRSLQYPPAVIITTAYKEFAYEAFDLDAIDYLLKPVTLERFLKAINKMLKNFAGVYESENSMSNYIYLRTKGKMVKIKLKNILFIECLKDYVVIHRLNEPQIKIKQALNTLESRLPRNIFLRIHRSYIISKPKVTAYSKDFVEIGKQEIPIGRKYKDVTTSFSAE